MNIELSNGLDHLYQWDACQKVKIPENVPTVHFKWGNDAVSFDVVDGWVEIPPELTQKAGYILLWTYREDHTLDAARIPVERRPKPDGYAYTPTEVKTWESLDARIKALEKGGGVAGVSSINGQTGAVEITAKGLDALNRGQRKKLLKNQAVKAMVERYGIDTTEDGVSTGAKDETYFM